MATDVSKLPKQERGWLAKWIVKGRKEGWKAEGLRWILGEHRKYGIPENRLTFGLCDSCGRNMCMFLHPIHVPEAATAATLTKFATDDYFGTVMTCMACFTSNPHLAYHAAVKRVVDTGRATRWLHGDPEHERLKEALEPPYCFFSRAHKIPCDIFAPKSRIIKPGILSNLKLG